MEASSDACFSLGISTPISERTRAGRNGSARNVPIAFGSLSSEPARTLPPAHTLISAATCSAATGARSSSCPRSKRWEASERRLCRWALRRMEVGAKTALSMITLFV